MEAQHLGSRTDARTIAGDTHGPGTLAVVRGKLLVHGLTLGAGNEVVASIGLLFALHQGLGDVDDVAEQALGEILRELFTEDDAEDLFLLGVRGQVVAAEEAKKFSIEIAADFGPCSSAA